jgi:hypothetical protein
MFNHRLAEALKRIVASEVERAKVSETLRVFTLDHNIGRVVGKSIYFTVQDRDLIRNLLEVKGYNLEQTVVDGMERSERLALSPNEKAGGGSLKRHRISIKTINRKALNIAGKQLQLPPMSHLDIDWRDLVGKITNNCVILVENYENFNRFHETEVYLPQEFDYPLVIYRGDMRESRLDAVLSFLKVSSLPLLAAVDIDPYGLMNVLSMPNFTGYLVPEYDSLAGLLSSTKTKRNDLYDSHYAACSNALDNLDESHPARDLWSLIKKNKAGVVQEQFLRLKLPLIVRK